MSEQKKEKKYVIEISEFEKTEMVRLMDAAVRAHGSALNLGVCDRLIRIIANSKAADETDDKKTE